MWVLVVFVNQYGHGKEVIGHEAHGKLLPEGGTARKWQESTMRGGSDVPGTVTDFI
jgi:hypothetical protein